MKKHRVKNQTHWGSKREVSLVGEAEEARGRGGGLEAIGE